MAPNGMTASPDQALPSSTQDASQWTTNTGAPVVDNTSSLTVGRRGPVLLEDYHLIEKLAQFDRERIPERVVHARGMTAKGFFEVTHDITDLSYADLFSEVGKKTPVIARFSTVIHERGSPETMRDVRGFSVKFYTNEGNWDFVGNDIPVFFIRDGIKFPDMVHALKPNPRNHIQEGWRILDFLSHHPESCNILTWLLDDAGIPKDYRHMEGYGVHTFKLVNKEGKETYVKFHWRPSEGTEFLTDDEAAKVGTGPGEAAWRPTHATKDLFDAIEAGNPPEYKFFVQTMEIADEDKYEFDPLDATKLWPEDRFPLRPVGRMVLDKNIDNWFNENEMVAFNPGIVVPGILPSDDKLLQTRIFSYSDTQRYRLGANYLLLPVNAPRNQHHNNHYDGAFNITHRNEEIDYFPSEHNNITEASSRGPVASSAKVNGTRTKRVIEKENNFQQAGERYRTFDPERKERFHQQLLNWLLLPKTGEKVRTVWLGYWTEVDAELGKTLEKKMQEANAI